MVSKKDDKEKESMEETTPSTETGKSATPAPESHLSDEPNELEKLKSEILYVRAEADNFRKRILKEQAESARYANEKLIREELPLVDLFERALEHSKGLKGKEDAEVKNFVTGIEMIHSQLIQLFKRFGVEWVGQAGEKFDPQRHEAISEKEGEAGVVLEVLEKGATLNGRLLKPARVVVGK